MSIELHIFIHDSADSELMRRVSLKVVYFENAEGSRWGFCRLAMWGKLCRS
jgi:hypothetical protein